MTGREVLLSLTDVRPGDGWIYDIAASRVPVPLPVFGVQMHALWSNLGYWDAGNVPSARLVAHLDLLKAHGVRALRVDYGWSTGQPTDAPLTLGNYHNARLNLLLLLAENRGLQVLVTVNQSPAWTRPGTAATPVTVFPTDLEAWRGFCAEFLMLFGGRVALTGVECWNEPNLREFSGSADPVSGARVYAAMLEIFCEEFAAAGAMSPVAVVGGPSLCDTEWLALVFGSVPGLARWPGVLAVHPYCSDQTREPDGPDQGKGWPRHYGNVQELYADYGAARTAQWWTEFGFSVHPNTGSEPAWKRGVVSREEAARKLIATIELGRQFGVRAVFVYCAFRSVGDVHVQGFSLIEPDGQPSLQLATLQHYYEDGA